MDGDQARLLSDEAVVENLQRGEAVQNDVQQALARWQTTFVQHACT